MGLRNLPVVQQKPVIGDVVCDGQRRFRVLSVGLKYLSTKALDGDHETMLVKISSIFIEKPLPPQIEEEEGD